MKKFISLIVFLLLTLHAQILAQNRFFLGVSGGVSRMSFSGDRPVDGSYTSKTGFRVGAVADYGLTNDIYLSFQPSFVNKGTGVAYDIGRGDPLDSLTLNLDYLSLPLTARFLSPRGAWFVNGGFDVGVLLKATLKDINAGGMADVKNSLNNFDFMMLFGVGAIVPADPMVLTFELRYSQSLVNAGASDQLIEQLGISPRFRSSGFELLAGFMFPL